jgi:hypothetical protein
MSTVIKTNLGPVGGLPVRRARQQELDSSGVTHEIVNRSVCCLLMTQPDTICSSLIALLNTKSAAVAITLVENIPSLSGLLTPIIQRSLSRRPRVSWGTDNAPRPLQTCRERITAIHCDNLASQILVCSKHQHRLSHVDVSARTTRWNLLGVLLRRNMALLVLISLGNTPGAMLLTRILWLFSAISAANMRVR